MAVVNLTKISVIAVLAKIKTIEESNDLDKYSRIVELLDSTQSVFNINLDNYKNMELLADHIEMSTTGSVLWHRMRDTYQNLWNPDEQIFALPEQSFRETYQDSVDK